METLTRLAGRSEKKEDMIVTASLPPLASRSGAVKAAVAAAPREAGGGEKSTLRRLIHLNVPAEKTKTATINRMQQSFTSTRTRFNGAVLSAFHMTV